MICVDICKCISLLKAINERNEQIDVCVKADGDASICQCHCLPCGFESRLVRNFEINFMFLPSQYWDIITLPSHDSRDSGVNEYLVGQRWQCVRLVPSAEMAASVVCSKKRVVCEAHRAVYGR